MKFSISPEINPEGDEKYIDSRSSHDGYTMLQKATRWYPNRTRGEFEGHAYLTNPFKKATRLRDALD